MGSIPDQAQLVKANMKFFKRKIAKSIYAQNFPDPCKARDARGNAVLFKLSALSAGMI
jgi:hypothetical protein